MDVFGHDGGDPALYATTARPTSAPSSTRRRPRRSIRDALAVANVTAAPYGTKEYMMTNYGVEGTHYSVEDGIPIKTDTGQHPTSINAYVMVASPATTIAHPDFANIAKGQVEWQQRMGAFTRKTPFYGMQITEPSRLTSLSNDFEQLEDDIVRGHKKIGDMQQAVSDWKSKGGDKLRDWYRKILDENGPAAG
ncbi:extracellular solute-binding protein [Streptomyces hirsutus]